MTTLSSCSTHAGISPSGFGIHRCIGNGLVELQLRNLWQETLYRFERVKALSEQVCDIKNFVRDFSALPLIHNPG